jgi:hypothetical protein
MKKFLRVLFIMTLLITSFGAVNVKADSFSCTIDFDFKNETGCETPVRSYLRYEEGTGKASFSVSRNECGVKLEASESILKELEKTFVYNGHECPTVQFELNGDKYDLTLKNSVDTTLHGVTGSLVTSGVTGTLHKEEETSIPEGNVGDNFCSQKEVKQVLKFFGIIILLLKFAVPLIIIVKGTFLFYNAVVKGGDDDITKNAKELGIKIFIGVLIFFLPGIIKGILNLYNDFATVESEYTDCATCLLEPEDCSLS